MVWSMLFNKGMLEDYGLDMPYQLVRDGKWTLYSPSEGNIIVGGSDFNPGQYYYMFANERAGFLTTEFKGTSGESNAASIFASAEASVKAQITKLESSFE